MEKKIDNLYKLIEDSSDEKTLYDKIAEIIIFIHKFIKNAKTEPELVNIIKEKINYYSKTNDTLLTLSLKKNIHPRIINKIFLILIELKHFYKDEKIINRKDRNGYNAIHLIINSDYNYPSTNKVLFIKVPYL